MSAIEGLAGYWFGELQVEAVLCADGFCVL